MLEQKRIVIEIGFRTTNVRIEDRKYDIAHITDASFKRLRTLLDKIPQHDRNVELDPDDLTPSAYFYFGKRHVKNKKVIPDEPLGLADLLKNPEYSERSTMSDAEFLNWLSKHNGQPPSPRHG